MQYLIWSNEHRGWWKPNLHGYTTAIHKAGRFGYPEARKIALNANRYQLDGATPNEVIVLAPSHEQINLDLEYPDR